MKLRSRRSGRNFTTSVTRHAACSLLLFASISSGAVVKNSSANGPSSNEPSDPHAEHPSESVNTTHPIPQILHCDTQQTEKLTFAWLDATLQMDQVYPAVVSPIYDDIMGNTKDPNIIDELMHQVQGLIPLPGSPKQRPAKIACVDQNTAVRYPKFSLFLIHQCLFGADTFIIALHDYETIFICTAYWKLPLYPEPFGKDACPKLLANQFPMVGEFPLAQSVALFQKAVQIYGGTYIDLEFRHFVNVDMAITTRQTPSMLNVAVFLYLATNLCYDVPDLKQPPWTKMAEVNATATSNLSAVVIHDLS